MLTASGRKINLKHSEHACFQMTYKNKKSERIVIYTKVRIFLLLAVTNHLDANIFDEVLTLKSHLKEMRYFEESSFSCSGNTDIFIDYDFLKFIYGYLI